ncbi:uncharacterized protein LOC106014186 [Aplysia californica]|uniref:Uncharacterized protein LOC106014186 n=1 Tax=Aplysia californica TaxID=6500 RepID=A0ABM1AFR3_APLCA|nr:uncharacterized protein LOC106014186 [Aplysia californica]
MQNISPQPQTFPTATTALAQRTRHTDKAPRPLPLPRLVPEASRRDDHCHNCPRRPISSSWTNGTITNTSPWNMKTASKNHERPTHVIAGFDILVTQSLPIRAIPPTSGRFGDLSGLEGDENYSNSNKYYLIPRSGIYHVGERYQNNVCLSKVAKEGAGYTKVDEHFCNSLSFLAFMRIPRTPRTLS